MHCAVHCSFSLVLAVDNCCQAYVYVQPITVVTGHRVSRHMNQNKWKKPNKRIHVPSKTSSYSWSLQHVSKVTEKCEFSCCWFFRLCQVHRHSENHPTWLRWRPHHLERITRSSLRPRLHNPHRRVCAACRCPGGPAVPLRSARINGGNLPAVEGPLEGQPERCRSRQRTQRFLIYDCLLPG